MERTTRILLLAFCLGACAWPATVPIALAGDADQGPVDVADGLHAALQAGDEQRVRELLSPEVLIYESGGVERSLEEYASHHMHSDMAFTADLQREILSRKVSAAESLAVVSTQSRLSGHFRDKDVDLLGTETLVLERDGQGWVIRHVHWSSQPANR